MKSERTKLPPPLEAARPFVIVRYADFQDVRAGRVAEVAVGQIGSSVLHGWWFFFGMGLAIGALSKTVAELEQLAADPAGAAAAEAAPDRPA